MAVQHDMRPERAPTHRSTAEIVVPDRIHRDAKLKVSNLSARKPFVIPNFWNSAHLFPVDTQTLSAGIALTALPLFVCVRSIIRYVKL
ncbi:hypothetical protein CDAR_217951 [Caerostris darwini]|uniref:Uncharacterized protein n=1 Tax=Caerostris darwini TaxID=1538125 RepID=A0AAV4VN97_9ARAC|nr:hypothetical protein CDAR_217951 [Caerostris darwini]